MEKTNIVIFQEVIFVSDFCKRHTHELYMIVGQQDKRAVGYTQNSEIRRKWIVKILGLAGCRCEKDSLFIA